MDTVCRAPTSVGQQLLWIQDHCRSADGALNCPLLCWLDGPLDVDALRDALSALVARHESLRTTVTGRGSRLKQLIHPPVDVKLAVHDLDGDAEVMSALAVELRTRIDAEVWPVRATLWRFGTDRYLLCVNVHHLVTDAASNAVLFGELWRLYCGAEVTPAVHQYREFADWQHELQLPRDDEYWRDTLAGAKLPRLPASTALSAVSSAGIPPPVADGLRQLATEHGTTPFSVMLAVFYATLHRTTGQRDLTTSSVFPNRTLPEHQRIVGFLENLVMLRTVVPNNFTNLLHATRDTVMNAVEHQALPYHLLPVDAGSSVRADELVFQMPTAPGERLRVGKLRVESFLPNGVATRFRTEFAVVPRGAGMRVVLFSTDLDPAYAQCLVDQYVELATSFTCAGPNSRCHGRG